SGSPTDWNWRCLWSITGFWPRRRHRWRWGRRVHGCRKVLASVVRTPLFLRHSSTESADSLQPAAELLPATRLTNGAYAARGSCRSEINPFFKKRSENWVALRRPGDRNLQQKFTELSRVYCGCWLLFRSSLTMVTRSSGLTGFSR